MASPSASSAGTRRSVSASLPRGHTRAAERAANFEWCPRPPAPATGRQARPRARAARPPPPPPAPRPGPASAGAWDFKKAAVMQWSQGDLWNVTLDLEPGAARLHGFKTPQPGRARRALGPPAARRQRGGSRRPWGHARPAGRPRLAHCASPPLHRAPHPASQPPTPPLILHPAPQARCMSTSTWSLTTTASTPPRGRAAATASWRCGGATRRSRSLTTGGCWGLWLGEPPGEPPRESPGVPRA
jgi:hypothetical protein